MKTQKENEASNSALTWKRVESISHKTCIQMFIAQLFIITSKRKQPKCPSVDKWINKKVLCAYNTTLFGHKKKRSTDIYYNMNLEMFC